MSIVTDQALLEKLNNTSQSGAVKVEDPKILERLALMEKAKNPTPVEIPEPSDGDSLLDTLVGVGETALTVGSGLAAEVASAWIICTLTVSNVAGFWVSIFCIIAPFSKFVYTVYGLLSKMSTPYFIKVWLPTITVTSL